jgi:hypothetical protein
MDNLTPNVVVENPTVRRTAQLLLSIAGLVLSSALVLDSQIPGVDWSAWINPAWALYGFLAATFGLAVITPNIPKVNKPLKTQSARVTAEESARG